MTDQQSNEASLADRVNQVIGRIRPYIQADGGDIEVVTVDPAAGKVSVRLQGACRVGVERHLKEHVPEVKEVVSVE